MAGATEKPAGRTGSLDLPLITRKHTLGSGPAAMEVSALCFGVMGANYNRGVSPSRGQVIGLIRQPAGHGVTLFHTAQMYGPLTNEKLAGQAPAPNWNKVAVTTRFGHTIVDGVHHRGEPDSTPQNIRKVAEESLKSLGVDAIELFYRHRLDPKVPIEDVAGTVKDLIREGKVKRFGLCEVGPATLRRAHAEQPVTAVQSEYHLIWREPEEDVFSVLEEFGVGFVPYSPLNRGMPGGHFTACTRFDSGNDHRDTLPRFLPEALGKNLMVVETINRFARPSPAFLRQIGRNSTLPSPRWKSRASAIRPNSRNRWKKARRRAPGWARMQETMKASLLTGSGKIEVKEVPLPEIGPGMILIRVSVCGVCGSDMPTWKAGRGWSDDPIPGFRHAGDSLQPQFPGAQRGAPFRRRLPHPAGI